MYITLNQYNYYTNFKINGYKHAGKPQNFY